MIWKLPHREIRFPRRPLVMGIVNVNDDSFSGDGTLDVDAALQLAKDQAQAGADIIDVGAESARTNRDAITIEEEIARLTKFLEGFQEDMADAVPKDEHQIWPPVVSVNTWRPEVVEAVLPLGVELINDIGGLADDRNARLCAKTGASLLIMHTVGEPKVPHLDQQWPDIMGALKRFFSEKIAIAVRAGLSEERIVLDPGIDFAKQRDDNLTIYRELEQLTKIGRPILMPVSRKTVIGEVLDLPEPMDRDAGTIGCITASMRRGASIFRVHNVKAAYNSLRVLDSVRG